jgi:hypothetical protein
MSLSGLWAHGNALTVETPSHFAAINHQGWGTDLFFNPGQGSWCHIPIPSVSMLNDVRAQLLNVCLLFECEEGAGHIANVHVYDGASKPQEFNNLFLAGSHRFMDPTNTFTLAQPHPVAFGIGLSFFFVPAVGIDSSIPPILLRIAGAGATLTF